MTYMSDKSELRLKLLTSIAGNGFVYQPLEEHLVPRPFADQLVAMGKAELLEAEPKPKPKAKRPQKPKAPARAQTPDGW